MRIDAERLVHGACTVLALLLSMAIIAMVPAIRSAGTLDTDGWFLLASGREVVESGIPTTNPFTAVEGQVLAKAEAEAREIRAQGDAEAATFYAVFQENPELAEFLRKLDSLRLIMRNQTTLVLDTNVAPFDLLKPGSEVLGPVKSAAKDGE